MRHRNCSWRPFLPTFSGGGTTKHGGRGQISFTAEPSLQEEALDPGQMRRASWGAATGYYG